MHVTIVTMCIPTCALFSAMKGSSMRCDRASILIRHCFVVEESAAAKPAVNVVSITCMQPRVQAHYSD